MTKTAADLIITNARIFDGYQLRSETTVVVADGVITALGDAELPECYTATEIVDAAGGLLTPGFVDAHVHTAFGGIERNACDVSECGSLEEAAQVIRAYAAAHPELEWIVGGGWRMPWFKDGIPLATQLDELVPDRPAYLINADHHGAWANTKAMQLAGITKDTPDPADGKFERDAEGNPLGALQEGAMDSVGSILPELTAAQIKAGMLTGQDYLFSWGVTGWQEAILGGYGGYPDVSPQYTELVDAGKITGRLTGALWLSRDFDGMSIPEFVTDLKRRKAEYEREGFLLHTVKIMVDGVAENGTAALTDPYIEADDCGCAPKDNRGLAYFKREDLLEAVPLINEAGFDVHFHAIGDRAARYTLDALAAVPSEVRARRNNHIAHLHIFNPHDVTDFAASGATANMQALWACQDAQMVALTGTSLGERYQWQYPFGSFAAAGIPLCAGSDWPVSTPDPWQAIHVAVNRMEPGVTDMAALTPEQRLSLKQMLAAYTSGSARVLRIAGGRIAVGEQADLALADRDPFAAAETDIWQTKNVLTTVAGAVVYRAR